MRRPHPSRAGLGCCPCGGGLGAGAAYGYFISTGSGTGSATAGSLQPVTVTALVGGDTPASTLIPGGSADVILRVNNPNAYVVSVSGNGAITPDGSHSGCTTAGVSFTNQTGLRLAIGASGTGYGNTTTGNGSIQVSNNTGSSASTMFNNRVGGSCQLNNDSPGISAPTSTSATGANIAGSGQQNTSLPASGKA